MNSVVPALIAGNAVLLKQAAQTLLVGDRFQKAFDSIGLPKGLFTHIVLEHSQTEAIISGGHVDHVAFTGSVEAAARWSARRPEPSRRSASNSAARIRPMSRPTPI